MNLRPLRPERSALASLSHGKRSAAEQERSEAESPALPSQANDWPSSNVNEQANAIGKDSAYVARVLRLTLLAPEIVHTILTGNLPNNFSVDCLKQALPVLWSEQKKLLGIG